MKVNSHKIDWRVPEVFNPLLKDGLRYLGAWGGRGGAKSHFFAAYCVIHMLNGQNVLCVREIQKSINESVKRLIESKIKEFDVERFFTITETSIRCNYNDAICIFRGLQSHTADSVKSLEGFDICWVEEAQSLSDRSLTLLVPTIRKEKSRLLFSWNPMRPTDPIDMMLRGNNLPTNAAVVHANWSDNPWFPEVLEQERLLCLENTPERYGHIWEGEYATVLDGAYYARHLTDAQLQGRIGFVAKDYLQKVYACWDIGSSSRKADATSIWIVQFIGTEVRVLDYYEAVGQPFDAHIYWLRQSGYEDAVCVLPHDGRKHDTVYQVTPEGYLHEAGFTVDTVPNQGAGAALQRIDAARLMFPNCRFNEETTAGGRDALGWYHEKRDEKRGIGLGPEHDQSSHAADAWGLVAIYRQGILSTQDTWGTPIRRNLRGIA
jgi:phage terminase large subunit